jgi:hypothetical protein
MTVHLVGRNHAGPGVADFAPTHGVLIDQINIVVITFQTDINLNGLFTPFRA